MPPPKSQFSGRSGNPYYLANGFIYPTTPGTGRFVLNAPRFEHAVVELPGNKPLTIDVPGADGSRLQCISDVSTGGPARHSWIAWNELRRGPNIDHTLSDTPTTWGTGPQSPPSAPCSKP